MKKLICLLAILLVIPAVGLADIYFQPGNSFINNVGEFATVDVMFSGAAAPWLAGFDIDITYDPAIVAAGLVNWPDSFLGTGINVLQDAVFGSGLLNVAEISLVSVTDLQSAQSGHDPFRLFQISFEGLANGLSPLAFSRVELTDGDANLLAPGNTPAGRIAVGGTAPIPEPGSLLLLVPVLGTLAVLKKRLVG